jgi:hypothetical protein
MEPLTPLDTLCRIILRAREYEAQVPTDYDGNEAPENVDDEGEGTLSVLDDSINTGVEEELSRCDRRPGRGPAGRMLAFAWVGQGTYDAADWDEAIGGSRAGRQCRRGADGNADAGVGAGGRDGRASTSAATGSATSARQASGNSCSVAERFPRTAAIAVKQQAGNRQRTGRKSRSQLVQQAPWPAAAPCSGW